jgi:hypothetical protein
MGLMASINEEIAALLREYAELFGLTDARPTLLATAPASLISVPE